MTSQLSSLLFVVVMLAIFWFFAIRPQQQRVKQQAAMLAQLKPGDEVITAGGIYATILTVGDRVRIRIADGSEMEIVKEAVASLAEPKGSEQDPERPDSLA